MSAVPETVCAILVLAESTSLNSALGAALRAPLRRRPSFLYTVRLLAVYREHRETRLVHLRVCHCVRHHAGR
jgi:hypothetical protein